MELKELKVTDVPVEASQRERVARVYEALPLQRAHNATQEAALRFGLPMTGQEIHERVRRTLRPRWTLPFNAKIWLVICAVFTIVLLGILAPWGWTAWSACSKRECGNAGLGFGMSMIVGFLAAVAGSIVLAGNLQRLARVSAWTHVHNYVGQIPEPALLKYADALESGLFKTFYVVEPFYEGPTPRRRAIDPWLVGGLEEHRGYPGTNGHRAYVVLAYWE